MKKTLIALAVATSAVVSGSVFAWTPGDFNGSFEMGGQLTPPSQTGNPWSVAVGNNVTDLDATLEAGQKDVSINVTNAIGILGIRPTENEMFNGQVGITPQISYGSAVNLDSFAQGIGTLTLPVKSGEQDIGTLTTKIYAGGVYAVFAYRGDLSTGTAKSTYASAAGKAFYGGVGKTGDSIDSSAKNVVNTATTFFTDITSTYQSPTGEDGPSGEFDFSNIHYELSGLYASGIKSGEKINITLNEALSEATTWTASLPIT
ncbi:fimbrial protein, partial [Escherichia sp. MOD1-EC6099]|uniref:F4 family fimbrial subunit n=1 Tax=Escherichia sp. MOD1-EC6099 TaxID=2093885 RepID=UPI000CF79A1F